MANMSYCKFENTYRDLDDCYETMSNEGVSDLSESEMKYYKKLVKMCKEISDDYSEEEED